MKANNRFDYSGFSKLDSQFKTSLTLLEGHSSYINQGLITPDNKFIITASGSGSFDDPDNSIRIWNIATKKQEKVLKSHQFKVTSLAMTQDMKTLYSGDFFGVLKVWDFSSGIVIQDIQTLLPIHELRLNNSHCKLVSIHKGFGCIIWNCSVNRDHRFLEQVYRNSKIYTSPYISRNADFYSCFYGNQLHEFKLQTNQEFVSNYVNHSITSNYIVSDSRDVIIFWINNVVNFWHLGLKKFLFQYKHEYTVQTVNLSIDQTKVISCTLFSTQIWDYNTKTCLYNIDYVGNLLNVSDDCKLFLTRHSKGLGLYYLSDDKHKDLFQSHKSEIISAFNSKNMNRIVTLGKDKVIKFWSSESLELLSQVKLPQKYGYESMSVTENEKFIVAATGKDFFVVIKSKGLFEEVREFSDECEKDPALSEYYVSRKYSMENYEALIKWRF